MNQIPSLEWLAELEDQVAPDDDFFYPKDSEKPLGSRLYFVFSNDAALVQFLSLWNTWSTSKRLPKNHGGWAELFRKLHSVRPWGASDRLHETGLLEDWKQRHELKLDSCFAEIELWFRREKSGRDAVEERVRNLITNQGGRIRAFLRAYASDTRNRKLLSPAESVNSLTVGALHCDSTPQVSSPAGMLDPFVSDDLPALISGQGRGYRRSIKPEIMVPGGRQLWEERSLAPRMIERHWSFESQAVPSRPGKRSLRHRQREYRKVRMWFDPKGCGDELEVKRTDGDWRAVRRGTTQHEIFEGDAALAFVDGDEIKIPIYSEEYSDGPLDAVPYSLVVSLEVAPNVDLPIYDEIRARIRSRVRVDA